MNINEIKAFIAVVETRSITQAAIRLNRVQSSISHRIKNLENSLGVSLLDRQIDGIIPTAQGKVLYDYAIQILNLVQDCQNKIISQRDYESIRLGLIECLPPYIVNSLIDLIYTYGHRIDISVGNTINLLEAYNKNELDMVIVGSGFSHTDHGCRVPLFSDDLVVVTEKSAQPIDEFCDLDKKIFLISSRKAASLRNFNILFEETGIAPRQIVECGSYPILFSNIASGKGVSLVLRCSISRATHDQIKIHNLHGRFSKFQIELLYRKNLPYLDVPKLRKLIVSIFQDKRLTHIGY